MNKTFQNASIFLLLHSKYIFTTKISQSSIRLSKTYNKCRSNGKHVLLLADNINNEINNISNINNNDNKL